MLIVGASNICATMILTAPGTKLSVIKVNLVAVMFEYSAFF